MWIALAVIAFVAGQIYLFHCLKKLDRFLDKHPLDPKDTGGGNPDEDVV